jgi:hypothetical protein
MPAPVPRTWSPGELATFSQLNTHIRDAIEFFIGEDSPWALLTGSSGQSINNTDWTALSWNVPLVDHDDMHSGGTTVTIKTPGCYAITAQVMFADNSTGVRGLSLDVVRNGVLTPAFCRSGQRNANLPGGTGTTQTALQLATYVELEIGDQTLLYCRQTSAGNLDAMMSSTDLRTWLSVRWIGSL